MNLEFLNEQLNIFPSADTINNCEKFIELFKEYNSHTNLMSKNDLNIIFEKHITDSLSIVKFKEFQNCKKIVDIGTGGGFPAVPVSIFFNDKKISAVDSIKKKIKFIEIVKTELNLDNLTPICSRIEELNKILINNFDLVLSRALSDLRQIAIYSSPYLKKGGFIAAYKSKNANNEIKNAKAALKKYNMILIDTIPYTLNLKEHFDRCLVILQKQ